MIDGGLYLGDCLEIMPLIADESIDLILCDLPYGTTASAWDTVIPIAPLWDEYRRILKPRGTVALFCVQPFTSQLVLHGLRDRLRYRYMWVWIKNNKTNLATRTSSHYGDKRRSQFSASARVNIIRKDSSSLRCLLSGSLSRAEYIVPELTRLCKNTLDIRTMLLSANQSSHSRGTTQTKSPRNCCVT